MTRFQRLLVLSLGMLLGALGLACAPPGQTPGGLERVTFMAGFKPQANLPFVATYVAQEKGLFRDQGLEVEIKHSGGQAEHYKLLANGQIQFTTAPAEDVLKQVADPGLPFVAVALFGQRGDRAFAILADSGIRSPKDWEGKTVGYKVFPTPDYLALLKANGVDRSKIKEVSVGFDPRILTEGKVDVYPVFVSNEPNLIAKLGFQVRLFQAADYGVPALGLTYITHRDLLQRNPSLVARFLKATLKALALAYEREEEVLDIVMKYAPQEDRAHQRFMLRTEKEAALTQLTRQRGLGWMTLEQWRALHDTLLEFGGLAKPLDVRTAFSDEPLRTIYKDGRLPWP